MGIDPGSSDPHRGPNDFLHDVIKSFFFDGRDQGRQVEKKEAFDTWLEVRRKKTEIRQIEIKELKKLKDKFCEVIDMQIKRLEMGVE